MHQFDIAHIVDKRVPLWHHHPTSSAHNKDKALRLMPCLADKASFFFLSVEGIIGQVVTPPEFLAGSRQGLGASDQAPAVYKYL